MLIVISPAKTLDTNSEIRTKFTSEPEFIKQTEQLISVLQKKNAKAISKLMGTSQSLGQLNFERYQQWNFTTENKRQAIYTFNGDVYEGLKIQEFTEDDILFAQDHLRIISGLYGILKPLDLMQPYRLEMGTKLSVNRKKDLYVFWRNPITDSLNNAIQNQGDSMLINLASNEYFNAIDKAKLKARVITPVFKDFSGGEYKVLSFFAKKARGMMSRFILKNKIDKIENLLFFDEEGYHFKANFSTTNQPVFTRN